MQKTIQSGDKVRFKHQIGTVKSVFVAKGLSNAWVQWDMPTRHDGRRGTCPPIGGLESAVPLFQLEKID